MKLFETNENENQTGVNMFIERGKEKFELEHTLYVYTQLDVIFMSEEL